MVKGFSNLDALIFIGEGCSDHDALMHCRLLHSMMIDSFLVDLVVVDSFFFKQSFNFSKKI